MRVLFLILFLSGCYVQPKGPPNCKDISETKKICGFGDKMMYVYDKDI